MPFAPGQSGNLNGRPKDKPWRQAIDMALRDKDGMALRRIANRLVAAAEAGDMQAISEIANRLDGKPVQMLEGNGDAPLLTINLGWLTGRAVAGSAHTPAIEHQAPAVEVDNAKL